MNFLYKLFAKLIQYHQDNCSDYFEFFAQEISRFIATNAMKANTSMLKIDSQKYLHKSHDNR